MNNTLEKKYSKLTSDRSPYLDQAYRASELTVPFLIPRNRNIKDSANSNAVVPTPWQSVGSIGLNNLSNKLLLTTFPPNHPFHKLAINDFTALDILNDEEARAAVEEAFSAVERTTKDFVERSGIRPPMEEAFKHMLVAGNILIHRLDDGGIEIFHMDQYVVERDPNGKVRQIIIEEIHTFASLDHEIQVELSLAGKKPEDDETRLSMFTSIRKQDDNKNWKVSQEILGIKVVADPNKDSFKDAENPWFALRFHSIKGANWGRSYISGLLGDLEDLETLYKSVIQGAEAMAMILFLIKPGSNIRPDSIIKKKNGGFVLGNKEDLGVLQMEKFADFKIALELIDRLTRRIQRAMLQDDAITRDAERVTLGEIRLMASRLEEALGGFYSIFTQEFQLPYLKLTTKDMERKGQLPKLPGDVKFIIITGLDALGRNSEAEQLRLYIEELTSTIGPELVNQIVKPIAFAKRLGAAKGIDTKGLVVSEEEWKQMKQQAMQQQMAEKLGPAGIKGGIDLAKQASDQDAQQEEGV